MPNSSGVRFTYEEVRAFFENQGCELLEDQYKNARTKMRYRCSCGREAEIVLYSFQNGNRCRQCGNRKIGEHFKKNTTESLKAHYVQQGCELLGEYVHAREPMLYRCKCGTIAKMSWNNFQRGKRCWQCALEKRTGKNNYQWITDREAKRQYDDFKQRCYKMLRAALGATGVDKNARTEQMLGYSVEEFQKHLVKHPRWKSLEGKAWHVDHVFPIKAFADYGVTDIKVVNCLENIQPLPAADNISKGGKYEPSEFEAWLAARNIVPTKRPTWTF